MARARSNTPTQTRPSADAETEEFVDFTVDEAKEYLSRLISIVSPRTEPMSSLRGLCTQIDHMLATATWPLPPEKDPLLGYSMLGRMCGRSPQTIRRWVLEGLLKSEVERPGAPRKVRLSVIKAFFAAGTLDLHEVQEKYSDDEEIRREGEGGDADLHDQLERVDSSR